jgi:hypothetical protein
MGKMSPVVAALWVEVFSAAGSVAAIVAAIGGVFAIGLYGRRASIEVVATALSAEKEIFLSIRPSVRAVGVLRLVLDQGEGAWLRVTEVFRSVEGPVDGLRWDAGAVFGQSFVDGGETLRTTTLVGVGALSAGVIGWRVSFGVSVARRWPGQGRWLWADQVFVPVPGPPAIASGNERGG